MSLFKKTYETTICNNLLNTLSTDDRCYILECVGRGTLDYLNKNTKYHIAYSTQKYYPVDGLVMTYENGKVIHKAIIEIKTFYNVDQYRSSNKYQNLKYRIDAKKLTDIEAEARKYNCRPILIAFFSNEMVVWDLDKTDWYHSIREEESNDLGVEYGKSKSKGLQAYLPLCDAIYRDKDVNIDLYYKEIHKNIFGPKKSKPITEDEDLPF